MCLLSFSFTEVVVHSFVVSGLSLTLTHTHSHTHTHGYRTFPDNVSLIENLRHLDYRLNTLKAPPPSTTRDLSSLSKLNLRGTNIREINTKYFPVVEELNCADNRLRNLVLFEGPLKTLIATNNSE